MRSLGLRAERGTPACCKCSRGWATGRFGRRGFAGRGALRGVGGGSRLPKSHFARALFGNLRRGRLGRGYYRAERPILSEECQNSRRGGSWNAVCCRVGIAYVAIIDNVGAGVKARVSVQANLAAKRNRKWETPKLETKNGMRRDAITPVPISLLRKPSHHELSASCPAISAGFRG